MSLDHKVLVAKVKDFVHARTMQEHWQVTHPAAPLQSEAIATACIAIMHLKRHRQCAAASCFVSACFAHHLLVSSKIYPFWNRAVLQAYQVFHENVRWDAPPILLNGREKLRVVAYFAKRICLLDFTEHSIKEKKRTSEGTSVEVICTFNFRPLPKHLSPSLGLGATIVLDVTDDLQTVSSTALIAQ